MPGSANTFSKMTAIIVVDAIEPCLAFWTERLGFEKTAEVPEGDKLGFVILQKDKTEVMYQSRASVQADVPAMTKLVAGQTTSLFIEVSDIEAIERAVKGLEILVPRRKTFYGADELFVRAPCGTVVGFAQFGKE